MFGELFSFFRKGTSEPELVAAPPRVDTAPLDVSALVVPPAAVEAAPVATEEPGPVDPAFVEAIRPKIVEAISTVFDPEIPVNIYELGLIYDVDVTADGNVLVKMTLTSPACPSAQQLPAEVQWKVKAVEGVRDAKVQIVWEPPWTAERMSEAARMSLGML